MSYLVIRCIFLMMKTRTNLINDTKSGIKSISHLQTNLQKELRVNSISADPSTATSAFPKPGQINGTHSPQSQQAGNTNQTLNLTCRWKVTIAAIAVIYIVIAGVCNLLLTFGHFEQSGSSCGNPSIDTLVNYPELQFWSHCTFQTLPFTFNNEINCNCRKVQIGS